MVVRIKKVILKFIGTGIKDKYQACVNIYDTCGNKIHENKTYNGKLVLNLEENTVYKLVAKSYNEEIRTAFYVTEKRKKYIFFFNRSIVRRTITFLLTDANYYNLPIEKGDMFLWQQ